MALSYMAAAFLLSLALTGGVQRYAAQCGMIDRPNDRSSHAVPTPRGGGLAIVAVFFALGGWGYYQQSFPADLAIALVGGGGAISLIGFLDDRSHVSAMGRLVVHFGAATWVLVWHGNLPVLQIGRMFFEWPWWGTWVAVFFLVWMGNLYNFMDGIDGIAGVEAVGITLGAAAILVSAGERGIVLPLLILAGAACGFLRWNWPPAKIFMGDVGSGFLGFVLGVFALYIPTQSRMSFWSWLILFGVFLTDATVTLLVRVTKREKLHLAHRTHAYQRLAQKYNSHRKITLAVLVINALWLFPLACFATFRPAYGAWLAILAMIPLVIISLWAGAGKKG